MKDQQMNIKRVPKSELNERIERFVSAMDKRYPAWETCAVTGSMSLYYFTGTICDGVLLIIRDKAATLWVRKSYERAVLESELDDIRKMSGFQDIASSNQVSLDSLYLDMSAVTLDWYERFRKYMPFDKVLPIDSVILGVRAVKSTYEIEIMRRAGETLNRLLREKLPSLLYAGISEAELGAEIFSLFIRNGYHGVSRFSMRNTDVVLGHIGFAESSLYPSIFNGASGTVGLCAAAPVLGSRYVKLKEGDLVYIDVGFGIDGYNVDKTLIFSFGGSQPEHVSNAHRHCLELERMAVSMMKPGAKPSEIYDRVISSVNLELRDCFMGAQGRGVRFLGHGVGLYVDEFPVIAKGFDSPLECGMTIAIEPKFGIEGVGMVGSENTYLITETGALSLTGAQTEIILC